MNERNNRAVAVYFHCLVRYCWFTVTGGAEHWVMRTSRRRHYREGELHSSHIGAGQWTVTLSSCTTMRLYVRRRRRAWRQRRSLVSNHLATAASAHRWTIKYFTTVDATTTYMNVTQQRRYAENVVSAVTNVDRRLTWRLTTCSLACCRETARRCSQWLYASTGIKSRPCA